MLPGFLPEQRHKITKYLQNASEKQTQSEEKA